jgi:hypothetical protein
MKTHREIEIERERERERESIHLISYLHQLVLLWYGGVEEESKTVIPLAAEASGKYNNNVRSGREDGSVR